MAHEGFGLSSAAAQQEFSSREQHRRGDDSTTKAQEVSNHTQEANHARQPKANHAARTEA